MGTDRSIYLALRELTRRHQESGASGRSGPLTDSELCCFSQHGEDGVIAEIVGRIGIDNSYFVEFGVESGREGNCVFLADVLAWEGLFIEADPDHYRRLAAKYAATPRVTTINAAVTPETVEELFVFGGVPADPDLVSIDVDGGDYWIWDALTTYRPRIVVIEYNAALPTDRRRVQPREHREAWNGTDFFGASLAALRDLGTRKGYRLVHTELAGANAFFVREDVCGERFAGLDAVPQWGHPNYFLAGVEHPHDPRSHRMGDPIEDPDARLVGAAADTDAGLAGPSAEYAHAAPSAAAEVSRHAGILRRMTESGDTISDPARPFDDDAADPSLTKRRIAAAMSPLPAPVPEAQPVAPHLTEELEHMRTRADLFGFIIAPRRRFLGMRSVKRALRRLQAQTFTRQSEFNAAATSIAQLLITDEHSARRSALVQARGLTGLEERIASLERRVLELRAENASLRGRVEQQRVVAESAVVPDGPPLDYLGLQMRFRGDEEEITNRQRMYVERFAGQQDILDIGCGRGEFLRLVRDAGIIARGVDIDADMVSYCRAGGLDVEHDDGLTFLDGLPDESLGGVFAAQVIEHLSAAQIASFMRAAHRTLRSGGLLILETVNPASVVALTNFYLDFTHVKPIHPLALQWLSESLAFAGNELVYLSPVVDGPRLRPLPAVVAAADGAQEFDDAVAATNEVLYGPRDYALIASRP